MSKQDLLDEAAALGIEGLDESFTNKKIQEAIDEARAEADESPEAPEDEIVPVEEKVAEEPPVASESMFHIEQLRPYAEQLFGVGGHVIVGAVSAGFIPNGQVTKAQVAAGIDQYLNMPIEQKEG